MTYASTAAYYVKYSPGPSATTDAEGNHFTLQHGIEYDYYSNRIYTRLQKLRIDVMYTSDRVTCGRSYVSASGVTDDRYDDNQWSNGQFPRTYYNTPYWYTKSYWTNHYFGGIGHVKYVQGTGELPSSSTYPNTWCNDDYSTTLGRWTSTVTSSHQWSHIRQNGS